MRLHHCRYRSVGPVALGISTQDKQPYSWAFDCVCTQMTLLQIPSLTQYIQIHVNSTKVHSLQCRWEAHLLAAMSLAFESQLHISSAASHFCRSQLLAVICQSEPSRFLEKILVSYFSWTHSRVIDFSFSGCKIDFLSFTPVRNSWHAVATNLVEVCVKPRLTQGYFIFNWERCTYFV